IIRTRNRTNEGTEEALTILVGVIFSSRLDPWRFNRDFRALPSLVKTIVQCNLRHGRCYQHHLHSRASLFSLRNNSFKSFPLLAPICANYYSVRAFLASVTRAAIPR